MSQSQSVEPSQLRGPSAVTSSQTHSVEPCPVTGACLVFFAHDIGFNVDLEHAQRLVRDAGRRRVARLRRRAPAWFDYSPPPLALLLEGQAIEVAGLPVDAAAECTLFDFGGVTVRYRIPFDCPLNRLSELSERLYDNDQLLTDARRRVAALLETISPAVEKAELSDFVEDYIVFSITGWPDGVNPASLLSDHRVILARILEAEQGDLSPQQVRQALAAEIAYATEDLSIIDWNSAIVFDREPADVLAVLEHANVELLEMRWLDSRLDVLLDRAHDLLQQIGRRPFLPGTVGSRELRAFAALQTDSALLFEGVHNAIKLIGNQYLARLYKLAATRLNLPEWDASVLRKLETAESVYQKMSDAKATLRLEILEIVIILLILISIILPMFPGAAAH